MFGLVVFLCKSKQVANYESRSANEQHLRAEQARENLKELGVAESYYQETIDLRKYSDGDSLLACSYNPLKDDKSPMPENPDLFRLLRIMITGGREGAMAKIEYEQLELKLKQQLERVEIRQSVHFFYSMVEGRFPRIKQKKS
ncbi:hypothetical protein I6N90_19780 [Paenibacillus sp. GSMTC-2017]|uniref:hypothetical protein n=1 Tax=Paenibacillus sp. GSMTC-2017 TaxID=2794350 RepID=UPI0018D6F570|nr:hypothetical protein [Paenibacillus sp. GSMTC-2017]MBH5320046.1 hypothetical protein [Paenibacillus sp. GSMTC-2017]